MCRHATQQPGSLTVLAVTTCAALVVLAACTGSGSARPSGSGLPSGSTGLPGSSSYTGAPTSGGPSSAGPSSSRPTRSAGRSTTPLPTSDPAPLTTVPTSPVRTRSAVPLSSTAPFGTGVTARVTTITHGVDRDQGPGAATGRPTVEFHLRLTNGTGKSISLSAVGVSAAYGGSSTPAIAATSSTTPFTGSVAAGKHADAVYAFAVPTSSQGKVELTVSYRAGTPTVLLTGSAR